LPTRHDDGRDNGLQFFANDFISPAHVTNGNELQVQPRKGQRSVALVQNRRRIFI